MARDGLDPRRIAYDVLLRVETSGAFADALLGRALARSRLDAGDRGLATRLVYGTLAWLRRLDWIADHWVKPKSDRLEAPVRVALRLGLFQLHFSDRIPPFAAVDTTVELVKEQRARASTLVNAVLRRAVREGAPSPPEGSRIEDLGLRWSHPDWMVRRWVDELGVTDAEALLRANNEPAPLVYRSPVRDGARDAVVGRWRAAGLEASPGRYSPFAVVVAGGIPAEADAIPQGEASQLVPLLVSPSDGSAWLDACAAPGGKASELAELAPSGTQVVAIDLHRRGLRRIRELTAPRDVRMPDLIVADAARPPFAERSFDAALVDAPCSGTGTLRSHPEIRWRLRPEDVTDLRERQLAILEGVAPLVRPGGSLVYATCSLFTEENDGVVGSFLSRHPHWTPADARRNLPSSARALVTGNALRTLPHAHGLDGFFAVRLERSRSGSP